MYVTRADKIPPFLVMDVLEKAKNLEQKGAKVIHLEIGEPDFNTPKKIAKAAIEAINRGETHYTHSLGIYELRSAITKHYKKRYGVKISPEQVVVTMGVSPALLLTLCALVNAGDEVILSNPTYACYPNFVRYIDGNPVFVPVAADNGFILEPDKIQESITPKTRAIIINSPSNPTGAVLPSDVMRDLARLKPYIISDEIYHGLVYGEKEHSILEFTDRAFVVNGFSKLYAMTGWRLGYIIAPPEFVRPIQKSQQNLFICAGSVSQWAGVSALTEEHPEVEEMVTTYNKRRIFMIDALRKLGFKIAREPKGAFYILADASHLSKDSHWLAFDILEKAKVAVTPGIDFGAEGFLRFSYANSIENIKEGCKRLKEYIKLTNP
jgi:aspartate/methionine/tyrosine aminotransferase